MQTGVLMEGEMPSQNKTAGGVGIYGEMMQRGLMEASVGRVVGSVP